MLESLKLCFNITLRNWTVYKKDLISNISPTVADPALIMVSLGLGLGAYLTNVEGMSYMQFLAPGLTVATALFTSFFESSYGFYVRMTYENVFKAMLTTPIGVPEVVMGEMLWVALKGAVMAVGVAIVLALFGMMANPWLIPALAIVGFLVALPCGAMGLLATALVNNINQFQTVYSFIIAPLYFLSGIFFPISQMAAPVRVVAEFFPLIHGVRLAQSLFWNQGIVDALLYNGSILILQSAVLCGLAYWRIKKKLVV
ncbi:ABC transporter permease [Peredibacter starrii]|uniref:Transport permease protein n=1 Tax=Peredibacter starrii TaxID=28202 RepID=A0AAX4HV34_9BACT|nr:ABC transporter permease [Peredibacter starrii]WPU66804.1 ABC transporter permease [Peredibacter starrii]